MDIQYAKDKDGKDHIQKVVLHCEPLNSMLSDQEKMNIFGCPQPDADVLAALALMEQGKPAENTKAKRDAIIDLMASKSLISAERAAQAKT